MAGRRTQQSEGNLESTEDISYMRDYVPDSYGRLLRLEFDAVKKEDGYTQKL